MVIETSRLGVSFNERYAQRVIGVVPWDITNVVPALHYLIED